MLKLNPIFRDRMILQRNKPVKIFGESDVSVTVILDGSKTVAMSENGFFCATLPSHDAGGPATLELTAGEERVAINDVYFGDVYLAGGQSNMSYTLEESEQHLAESAATVRMYTLEREWIPDRRDTDMKWIDICQENGSGISAAASHFAVDVASSQHVPVGIISCNQGASSIKAWISPETASVDSDFFERIKFSPDLVDIYPFNETSHLYETMLLTVAPYAIKGFLWYQGESDAYIESAPFYARLFERMARDWRRLWDDDELPFITTQLTYHTTDENLSGWMIIEEQQALAAKSVPMTKMIATGDCGDLPDIHPKDKKTIGLRLARCARGWLYGENIPYKFPVCSKAEAFDGGATLFFDDCGDGLYESAPLEFTVSDGTSEETTDRYVIDGDKISIYSDMPEIREVRFCFNSESIVSLYSSADIPAAPFRIRVDKRAV